MQRLVSNQIWWGYRLLLCGLLLCGLLLARQAQATGWNGQPPLVNKLKEHEFLAACREGNLPAVQYYLHHGGVNVDDFFLSSISGQWITGLLLASCKGHVDITEFLIQHGASPHLPEEDGWTPLCYAAQDGYEEVVKILLNAGADPNPQPKDGWTPLLSAVRYGYKAVVEMLLAAKANPDQQLSDGWTPLLIATKNGDTELVEMLLAAKADPNQQLSHGWTPLFYGVKHGRKEIVDILLHAKVDPNQPVSDGCTPLLCAAQNGHRDIVERLIAAGANPTAKWHHHLFYTKTPRDAAKQNRPLLRIWNPGKYDDYTSIMATLKQAEQSWWGQHKQEVRPTNTASPFARHSQTAVTERTPLLPAREQRSVSDK